MNLCEAIQKSKETGRRFRLVSDETYNEGEPGVWMRYFDFVLDAFRLHMKADPWIVYDECGTPVDRDWCLVHWLFEEWEIDERISEGDSNAEKEC